MKSIKIIIISILAFFLQGCPGEPEPAIVNQFDLINSSSEDIYIYSRNSSDAVLVGLGAEQPKTPTQKGEKWSYPLSERLFNDGSKLWILVFKKSTLETKTWQEIKDQGLYDKRYSFTLEELKAINFQITYDGN